MNMTNKKINLIPVFIIVALLIGVYLVFFSKADILDFNATPEVRRLNGFPTIVYTNKDMEKVREVITNQDDLAKFLNTVDESGYLIMRDTINFDKEMVLAVASSTNEYEGHEIKIKKIYENKEDNKIIVSVREIEPGESCEKIENKNIAVDLVTISDTTREIEFERVKEFAECN